MSNKEDKRISLEKLMVGHFIEKIPENCAKKVCYVLQGDGLWERRINALGTFYTHKEKFQVAGLHSHMEEGWELNVPKIPVEILISIVSFFRKINKKFDSEVFVQVFYDTEKEEYIAHVPKQEVSGASVVYVNDEDFDLTNKILVFEVHSHNTMGAFWSSIDDADEKSDRFYGVIGKVNQYYPEMLIRLSVGGERSDIDIEDIFEVSTDKTYAENFPAEWLTKVSKQQKVKVRVNRREEKEGYIQEHFDVSDLNFDEDQFNDRYKSEYKPIDPDERDEEWNDHMYSEFLNWRDKRF